MAQRKRKPLPGPGRATIESLAHDGRGVTHVDGKAVFVEGALPGEEVLFGYVDVRRDYAEAVVLEVLVASPERVEPRCSRYGVCGGCSYQHLAGDAQIRAKQALLLEQLRRIGGIEGVDLWPPLVGPHWGYRRRARLGVKNVRKKGRVLVGFRERRKPYVADLESCPVLHPKIGERLVELGETIARLSVRERLPQVEVAVGDARCALVLRILQPITEADRAILTAFAAQTGFDIYLQPEGPDSVVPLAPVEAPPLTYTLPAYGVEFRFSPTLFTQVNAEINRKLVERVMEVLDPRPEESLLDLFCGLGNFTLPLARRARLAVGIEGSLELVWQARANARRNGIENVEFYAADLAADIAAESWIHRRYSKILLDPSRAGAREVLDHIPRWGAGRVVYVSCNPSTLARDAGILVNRLGYRLIRAGVLDMFPQTSHVESMAWFEK